MEGARRRLQVLQRGEGPAGAVSPRLPGPAGGQHNARQRAGQIHRVRLLEQRAQPQLLAAHQEERHALQVSTRAIQVRRALHTAQVRVSAFVFE